MNENSLILTDEHTGRFIAVINQSPEKFVKSLDYRHPDTELDAWGYAMDILSEWVPEIHEIDINNAFDIALTPEHVTESKKPLEWTIDIYGDDGLVTLKLTKKFPIWF
jgi:hypothetical protein